MDILACPKCKGDLYIKGDKLICIKCNLSYETEDGIAQLIIDKGKSDVGT